MNYSVLDTIFTMDNEMNFPIGVFNHMKHLWTPSRNLMSVEAVAAELQIRLNCQMKCSDFFSFI